MAISLNSFVRAIPFALLMNYLTQNAMPALLAFAS